MLLRGASAGRALARLGSMSRPSAVAAAAASSRAASNITIGADGRLNVPNDPIIPFIEARSQAWLRSCAALRNAP
jgi:hypothetical protein